MSFCYPAPGIVEYGVQAGTLQNSIATCRPPTSESLPVWTHFQCGVITEVLPNGAMKQYATSYLQRLLLFVQPDLSFNTQGAYSSSTKKNIGLVYTERPNLMLNKVIEAYNFVYSSNQCRCTRCLLHCLNNVSDLSQQSKIRFVSSVNKAKVDQTNAFVESEGS